MARFRYAWRRLRRSPGYSIAVIASLTLGIGLNTALFSLVERVVIRPLPFPDEERLFALGRSSSADADGKPVWQQHFHTDVEAWTQATTIASLAAYSVSPSIVAGMGEPEYVTGAHASASLPTVLGLQPLRGRWYNGDVGVGEVVISETLWQRHFGRDPAILGRTLRLGGRPWTIVGVMPHGSFPFEAEFWTPFPPVMAPSGSVIARPHPGVSSVALAAELTTLSPTVATGRRFVRDAQIVAVPLRQRLYGSTRSTLLLVFGATTLLLVIACANVTNLSLARAIERRRELAVRLTLGASRSSVANLLVVEAGLLALIAAALGLIVAAWSSRIISVIGPGDIARLPGFQLTPPTVLFAVVCATLAGMGTSIAPIGAAFRAGTRSISGHIAPLSSMARVSRPARRIFVAAQLALALLLMTSTALVIEAVWRLTRPDHLGFSAQDVVIATLRFSLDKYPDSLSRDRFVRDVRQRVQAIPGVKLMALGPPPLVGGTGEGIREGFDIVYTTVIPGKAEATPTVWLKQVDPGYFRVYGIPLRSGREFAEGDGAASPRVAVINASAARLFFGDDDPIGRVAPVLPGGRACRDAEARVVGVLEDVLQRDVSLPAAPEVFVPLAQRCIEVVQPTIGVRSSAPPFVVVAQMRDALRELDPQMGTIRLEPMRDVVNASLERHRFLLLLLGIFAALGVVLAVTGVFAMMSYFVNQRQHEVGVRLALGAQGRDILGLVLREGALLTIVGTIAGLAAAFGATRLLAAQLYGMEPHNLGVLGAAAAVLATASLGAAYLPARRALRTNPVESLRAE